MRKFFRVGFSIALANVSGFTFSPGSVTAQHAVHSATEIEKPATAPPRQASMQEVVIRTRDFEFDGPEVIQSGPTHLRLVNEGPDFHHVWLVRLEQGKSVDDLIGHLSSGHGPMPDWAVDAGGPNTPGRPGEESDIYLDLKPGLYAMMCVIPAAEDGLPHINKGMIRPLTVVAAESAAGVLPNADIDMVLDDYTFGLSAPVTTGRHTFRVTNRAAQAHEVVVVRLAEGKTAGDYLQWIGTREGEEPGKILGGVTGLAAGESNIFSLDFSPGPHALLCFVPDAKTGQPHFMHGMIQEFRVGS